VAGIIRVGNPFLIIIKKKKLKRKINNGKNLVLDHEKRISKEEKIFIFFNFCIYKCLKRKIMMAV